MDNPEPKKKRGCFFYGCLTTLVLMLVIGISAFLVVRHFVNKYTDTSPMSFPKVTLSTAELEAVQKRVGAFRDAVEKGETAIPLVLTSDEINALIAAAPGQQDIKNRFHVSFEDDKVKGQISIPIRGRYLNGTGTFKVAVENGMLSVTPESILVKGNPLPDSFMAELRKKNLAEDFSKNGDADAVMSRIESLEIKNGAVTLKAQAKK